MADYPSEQELDKIRKWSTEKDGGPLVLVEFIQGVMNDNYGRATLTFKHNDAGEPIRQLEFITGGWSGNEDIIGALHGTMFWHRYWESSHRGGLYLFEIPVEATPSPVMATAEAQSV